MAISEGTSLSKWFSVIPFLKYQAALYFGKNTEIRASMGKPGKWKNFSYKKKKAGNGGST